MFLDIKQDRYFCLTPETEASFRAIQRDSHSSATDRDALLRAGLLIECDRAGSIRAAAPPKPARTSVLDSELRKSGAPSTGLALLRLASVQIQLRFWGLAGTLAAFASAKAHQPTQPGTAAQLGAVVAPFSRAARIITTRDLCLSHSIAVAWSLMRAGFHSDLIMGVRLGPFAAHCWVQHGDIVVNDQLDTIRTFTPILVL